ncbi:phosphoglycerate mutase [Lysobacter sp. A3-1-A15]|uniref:phosphoglycerate mutase n=1 Tax=Novilysobacter viscosus TaxID=3098602 RepID=UPI002ED7BDDA
MSGPSAIVLLPPRARFGGQRLPPVSARWLGRADHLPKGSASGERMRDWLDILPRGWPAAAVTRQRDAGDAAGSTWMRADPVYIQPDINGARLLAHGESLALTAGDAAAFLPALRPLFGDVGMPIDAPDPARWYLQAPPGSKLPAMASPAEAVGMDVFDHLPEGPDGRRWRALLSEAQVVLHNHPRNAQRQAEGLAPVNSLWFWGAGTLPDHVTARVERALTDDDTLAAFFSLGGASVDGLPQRMPTAADAAGGTTLVDVRHARDLTALDRDWLSPLLAEMAAGRLARITLDFADGHRVRLARPHRWRFWRRPWSNPGLGAGASVEATG